MTSLAPSVPPVSSSPGTVATSSLPPAVIDRSCRIPVLVLFIAAAAWLAGGALLGLFTAIKAHAPGFLSGSSWLTYGRVRPVSANAFVYGFVIQAGLGLGLWMFCRLGKNTLVGAKILTAAALLWNLGLALGLALVLAGGSTGYEWLEIPPAAAPVLFCSYVLLGAWALINLHARHERNLYVSQWFLLASLLWFPWVYSTAQLLLVFFPTRGVMQAIVNGWYAHNLFELCLAPMGLASIFYFLPKQLGRPLYNRGLALFGFWFLVLLGGWGGLRAGYPVPNWMASMGVVARVLLLVPVLAIAISWWKTLAGNRDRVTSQVVLRFVVVGACCYVLAVVLETLAALPPLNRVTVFTLYDTAVAQLKIHGFLAMALAGGVYYVAPRLAAVEWPSSRLIQLHFWSAVVGLALTVGALVIGGVVQGAGIENAQKDFVRVSRSTVPFLGMSTLGMTLLLVGYGAFLIHCVRLVIALGGSVLPWPGWSERGISFARKRHTKA